MKVLVTGGAGRLGYCVSKQLVEKGHSVRVFDLPQVEWSHVEALGTDGFKGGHHGPGWRGGCMLQR